MASKVVIMALLPIIILWVVAIAIRNTLQHKVHSTQKCIGNISDSGCFDPTEALDGII